jgi:hypothetical protein
MAVWISWFMRCGERYQFVKGRGDERPVNKGSEIV